MESQTNIDMPTRRPDYRSLLHAEYRRRRDTDAGYSLRTFARDIKLSHSHLSAIFSGKEGLSRRTAARISELLGFGEEEKDYFCNLVDAQSARSDATRQEAIAKLKSGDSAAAYALLSDDHFRAVSEWYHLAIVNLAKLPDFVEDTTEIARRLNLTPIEVEGAIRRLIRVGMMRRENQRLMVTQPRGATDHRTSSEASRKFLLQMLEKSKTTLQRKPLEERDHAAVVFTINKSKLTEAKAKLLEFRRNFCSSYAQEEGVDSVYCLSMQLFELTETNHEG